MLKQLGKVDFCLIQADFYFILHDKKFVTYVIGQIAIIGNTINQVVIEILDIGIYFFVR